MLGWALQPGMDPMSTRAHDRPSTAEELLGMPDDGFRYELVRGELRRMSPSGRLHGRVAARILVLLAKHREGEVHMRASWIFTRSDVIANAGVIVAACLVALTNTRWPDLIVGAAITAVVIKGGFAILSHAKKEESRQPTEPTSIGA